MTFLVAIITVLFGTSILNLGMALQKQSADNLPSIDFSDLWNTLKPFFGNRTWLVGTMMTSLGWLFYLIAISMAPLSIIAPLNITGITILVIIAIIKIGEKLSIYEWIGFLLIIIGVLLVSLSLNNSMDVKNEFKIVFLIMGLLLSLLVVAMSFVINQLLGLEKDGIVFGLSSGIFAGVGAIFTKIFSLIFVHSSLFNSILLIIFPLSGVGFVIFQTLSFITLQKSFQQERALVVVPIFNSISTIVPILGGIFIFGEVLVIGQSVGILLILMGTSALFKFNDRLLTKSVTGTKNY